MRVRAPAIANALAGAARDAPDEPGVYFIVGDDDRLLYVGKAANLRRRLLDHSRGTDHPRGRQLLPNVRDVRWTSCATEDDALCLEADVIVALAPPLNAAMVADDASFVVVEDVESRPDAVRFKIVNRCARGAYGGFVHLGKGKASWRAVRTNGGYSALMRLLWVAAASADVKVRLPAKTRGSSPPISLDVPMDHDRLQRVHALLSGRSNRLLTELRVAVGSADVPPFMRGPLERDLADAQTFYRIGPQALRALRLRHGGRPGPVDREAFRRMVYADVAGLIGPLNVVGFED